MEEGGKGGWMGGGKGRLEDDGFMAGEGAAQVVEEEVAEECDGVGEGGEGGVEAVGGGGGGGVEGGEAGEGGIVVDEGGSDGGDGGEEEGMDEGGERVAVGMGG